jgi:hypothetical protein
VQRIPGSAPGDLEELEFDKKQKLVGNIKGHNVFDRLGELGKFNKLAKFYSIGEGLTSSVLRGLNRIFAKKKPSTMANMPTLTAILPILIPIITPLIMAVFNTAVTLLLLFSRRGSSIGHKWLINLVCPGIGPPEARQQSPISRWPLESGGLLPMKSSRHLVPTSAVILVTLAVLWKRNLGKSWSVTRGVLPASFTTRNVGSTLKRELNR